MTIYVDLVFLLNIYIDFLILITVSVVLKRNTNFKRIILSSSFGSISLIFLFIPVNNLVLIIFKIVMGLVMCIIAFSYQSLKYTLTNFSYFYMISFILGGFIYYMKISYSNIYFYLIFFSPLILYFYIKQSKKLKSNYNLYYKVKIVLKNKEEYVLNGFLDTGNKLVDPITNKPIILVDKDVIKSTDLQIYYIPFNSLNNHNLLKCFKPSYVEIKNKKYFYLVGLSDKKFNMDGVECILNNKLMEEL